MKASFIMFSLFWFLLVTPGFYNIDPLLYGIDSRTYSDCFVEALIVEAEKDKNIVTVHAGMQMEPSIQLFRERFPDKFFDVGMAEQHAVTFAAGLSCGGLKPFCVIPSAFLQKAYDQVSLSHFLPARKLLHTIKYALTSLSVQASNNGKFCMWSCRWYMM